MAGRRRAPGAEVRNKRTTINWSESEYKRLEEVQKRLGLPYLTDVPRIFTLRQLELMESAIGDFVAE